jgi:acetyl esterase
LISFQLLEVPALDLTLGLPSHSDAGLGAIHALHREDVERLVSFYIGADGDPREPYVSPLRGDDHAGLPPAYIIPAESTSFATTRLRTPLG